jgi:hypothetical protein
MKAKKVGCFFKENDAETGSVGVRRGERREGQKVTLPIKIRKSSQK